MRIAVFGVGGVGGYFGGRLAQAGEDVVFIARGAHLAALRTRGLRVDSLQGDFVVHPVQATDNVSQVGTVDVVLVAVKAWQVPEAAQAIRPLVGPHTLVVPLQNGVEAPAQLGSVLGSSHVVGGVCAIVSFIEGPGHIRHTGAVPFVQVGEIGNSPGTRLHRLKQAFEQAGVKIALSADIQSSMWMKFLFIAPWSGLGALTRAPLGVWRGIPQTRRLAEQAVEEVAAVARASGVAIPADALQKTLAMYDGMPPEATASMQRDMVAGRPSELEAQVGAVVRLGQGAGVPTPLNAFIYGCLLPQERRARDGQA